MFVGLVREMHVREGLHRDRIDALTLEHYPGMTEKALEDIEAEANRRWPLEATLIVHRYGRMEAGRSHRAGGGRARRIARPPSRPANSW